MSSSKDKAIHEISFCFQCWKALIAHIWKWCIANNTSRNLNYFRYNLKWKLLSREQTTKSSFMVNDECVGHSSNLLPIIWYWCTYKSIYRLEWCFYLSGCLSLLQQYERAGLHSHWPRNMICITIFSKLFFFICIFPSRIWSYDHKADLKSTNLHVSFLSTS
jgi:hypothetical protein